MLPWQTLDTARAPGGATLTLVRRGDELVIRVDGRDLMGSRMRGSEEALAELACADLAAVPGARVLIGGLGLGFTVRAALRVLGPDAQVDVAELVPAVVAWNRGPLAHLADRPLEDPRVQVVEGDVADLLARSAGRYHAILLDVDNGPAALTAPANARLYDARGLARAAGALQPGGVLGVWSAADDPRFTERLSRGGWQVRVERVPAHRGGRKRHVVWLATVAAGGATSPP